MLLSCSMTAWRGKRLIGLGFLSSTRSACSSMQSAGLIPTVREQLDRLQAKRFRVSPLTRAAVLKLAGEEG